MHADSVCCTGCFLAHSSPSPCDWLCRIDGSIAQLGEQCGSIPECVAMVVKPGEPCCSLQVDVLSTRFAGGIFVALKVRSVHLLQPANA